MSKRVPKLRFKEFKSDGEWEEKRLGDIGKISMCKRILKHQTSEIGDIPFFKIGTFGKEPDAYITKELYEEFKTKYSYPKKGDILISASGTIGRLVIFDGSSAYFQDSNIVWIDNNDKLVKNSFLFYIYQNIKWTTDDNTIPRLYNDNLRNMEIIIPKNSKEQQKIANTLSSLDNLIMSEDKKLQALQTYKKGLMQQLFPKEGERVPKLRFKEFKSNGEWEEKKLYQFIEDFIVPMRDKPKDLTGNIPWCRIEDFDGMYLSKSKTNQGVTKETIKKMNLKIYPKNTLLVSCSADLGRCAIVKKELVTNQTFIGLVPQNDYDVRFLYYLMSNSKNKLNTLSTGTTISYLPRNEFENFEVKIPLLEEQQKIANTLSSFDNLIENQSKKIETLKEHKKGLMQKMFVSDEER